MRVVLVILLSLMYIHPAKSQTQEGKSKWVPDFAQVQFAGNMGLLSAGVGYDLAKNRVHLSLLDGFTPKAIAGSNINTINVRGIYDIANISVFKKNLTPYAGLTISFETTGNAFYSKLPERYSDGYYKYSAIHLLGFAGAKYPIAKFNNESEIKLYAETGTVDSYMYYYFLNTEQNFGNMFSMAIGAIYQF